MSKILEQDEVDALLRGLSGGDVETETEIPEQGINFILFEDFAHLDRASCSPIQRHVWPACAGKLNVAKELAKNGPFPWFPIGRIAKILMRMHTAPRGSWQRLEWI